MKLTVFLFFFILIFAALLRVTDLLRSPQRRNCQLPPIPNNGALQVRGTLTVSPANSSVTSGTSVTLTCAENYKLSAGSANIACLATGVWDGTLGRCKLHLGHNSSEYQLGQAAGQGRLDDVQKLLNQSNVDVNWEDETRYPPCKTFKHLKGISDVTALHRAVSACNQANASEIVKLLLDHGANVNVKEGLNDYTPLMLSASVGNVDTVRLLLDRGADINGTSREDQTALIFAAMNGSVETTRLLLDWGADITTRDSEGADSLILAAADGSLATVRLLLDRGADVNASDDGGDTALNKAAQNGHVDSMRLLLDRGADINSKTSYSALMSAAIYGHLEAARLLLDRGADVRLKIGFSKMDALLYAAMNNNTDIVKLLLQRGGRVNGTDTTGQSLLHYAAGAGNVDLVRYLVNQGANIESTNKLGETPLIYAASRDGLLDVVRLLLDLGANVNASDKNFLWTPLASAAQNGQLETARLLLDRGAGVDCKNGFGETPLILAINRGHTEITRLLLDHGADINVKSNGTTGAKTPLQYAAHRNSLDIVRLLLERGERGINEPDGEGDNALMHAIRSTRYTAPNQEKSRQLELVRLLLDRGADINPRNSTKIDHNPLMYAVGSSTPDIVKLLLERGADSNVTEQGSDKNLLMIASDYENVENARFLLDREIGGNINATSRDGSSPLMYAVGFWASSSVNLETVRLLLVRGADVNARRNNGETALMLAAFARNGDVAQLLLSHGASRTGCSIALCYPN